MIPAVNGSDIAKGALGNISVKNIPRIGKTAHILTTIVKKLTGKSNEPLEDDKIDARLILAAGLAGMTIEKAVIPSLTLFAGGAWSLPKYLFYACVAHCAYANVTEKPKEAIPLEPLRVKAGPQACAIIPNVIQKAMDPASGDDSRKFIDYYVGKITRNRLQWTEEKHKNMVDTLYRIISQEIVDPEYLALSEFIYVKEILDNHSEEVVQGSFEEAIDFLREHRLAKEQVEKVRKDKGFDVPEEERLAWEEAFGDKWHKAFPETNDPKIAEEALNDYVDQVVDRIYKISAPSDIQNPIIKVSKESIIGAVKVSVEPKAKALLKDVLKWPTNKAYFYSELYSNLECQTQFIEKKTGLQFLPATANEDEILVQQVDGERYVRACSKKAHQAGVIPGMLQADAITRFNAKYPGVVLIREIQPPQEPNKILVDQVQGAYVVRACSPYAQSLGIHPGMNEEDARRIFDLNKPVGSPVALMVRRSAETADQFVGFPRLEELIAKPLQIICENSSGRLLEAVNESIVSMGFKGKILFALLWVALTVTWPVRKIGKTAFFYLTGLPTFDKLSEKLAQRVLEIINDPSIKILLPRIIDRSLAFLEKKTGHAKVEAAAPAVAPAEEGMGAIARMAAVVVAPAIAGAAVAAVAPAIVGGVAAAAVAGYVAAKVAPAAVPAPAAPPPVVPVIPAVVAPAKVPVPAPKFVKDQDFTANGEVGKIAIEFAKTYFPEVFAHVENVQKSTIRRIGCRVAFWFARHTYVITVAMLDTRFGSYMIDLSKRLFIWGFQKYAKSHTQTPEAAQEFQDRYADLIERGFKVFKQAVRIAHEETGACNTFHAIVSMLHKEAVALQLADPEYTRYEKNKPTNMEIFVQENLLLAGKYAMEYKEMKSDFLDRRTNILTHHEEISLLKARTKRVDKDIQNAKNALELYAEAVQENDDVELPKRRVKLNEALKPLQALSAQLAQEAVSLTQENVALQAKILEVDPKVKENINLMNLLIKSRTNFLGKPQLQGNISDFLFELNKVRDLVQARILKLKEKQEIQCITYSPSLIGFVDEELKKATELHEAILACNKSLEIVKNAKPEKIEKAKEKWLKALEEMELATLKSVEWLSEYNLTLAADKARMDAQKTKNQKTIAALVDFHFDVVPAAGAPELTAAQINALRIALMKVDTKKATEKGLNCLLNRLESKETAIYLADKVDPLLKELKQARAKLESILIDRRKYEEDLFHKEDTQETLQIRRDDIGEIYKKILGDLTLEEPKTVAQSLHSGLVNYAKKLDKPVVPTSTSLLNRLGSLGTKLLKKAGKSGVNLMADGVKKASDAMPKKKEKPIVTKQKQTTVEDVRKFMPQKLDGIDKRVAVEKNKVTTLEKQLLELYIRVEDQQNIDFSWWVSRKGKDLYPRVIAIGYKATVIAMNDSK